MSRGTTWPEGPRHLRVPRRLRALGRAGVPGSGCRPWRLRSGPRSCRAALWLGATGMWTWRPPDPSLGGGVRSYGCLRWFSFRPPGPCGRPVSGGIVTKEPPLCIVVGIWITHSSITAACSWDTKKLDLRASLTRQGVWGDRIERPAPLPSPHTSSWRLVLCPSVPRGLRGLLSLAKLASGIADGLVADQAWGPTSVLVDSVTAERFCVWHGARRCGAAGKEKDEEGNTVSALKGEHGYGYRK